MPLGRGTTLAPGETSPVAPLAVRLVDAYRLRLMRRRLLWRAFRARRALEPLADRTAGIAPRAILCFATVRNEALRLPHFLAHHRALGVGHFLIVDNGSTDGTVEILREASDVSLWRTGASYRAARFGMDWLTWLMIRHGHGHWCLTLDADELFIYPHHESRPLPALTGWLEGEGIEAMGALMLDLYPEGPLSGARIAAGEDPRSVLGWFDPGNYSVQVQSRLGNLWIQGGPRARAFFAEAPRRAPTLNKVPLIRWSRRYAYVTSTHAALPPRLNRVYATDGGERISGVLLHTKFLNTVIAKSREEKERRQHFGAPEEFDGYYDDLIADPVLRGPFSRRLAGWRQLEALGLMSRGGWV